MGQASRTGLIFRQSVSRHGVHGHEGDGTDKAAIADAPGGGVERAAFEVDEIGLAF